jgi:putative transcriptional regulator
MKSNAEIERIAKLPLGHRLVHSLKSALAWERGEINLRVTVLPAPPAKLNGNQIRRLRKKLHLSQAVMAGLLGVSLKALQSWEQGTRRPSASVLRLFEVLKSNPQALLGDEALGVRRRNAA